MSAVLAPRLTESAAQRADHMLALTRAWNALWARRAELSALVCTRRERVEAVSQGLEEIDDQLHHIEASFHVERTVLRAQGVL